MIQISLMKKDGRYTGFISRGHAGYARAGEDIVCSAVSVLLINTVNSIEALTNDRFEVEEADGYLKLVMSEDAGEESQLLLRSMALGLRSVEETYGGSFLQAGEISD
jgi:uncharacterized protein YsxB (DUF464 family)